MAAANLLPSSSAKRYGAVPVKIIDDRTLLVAMIDPGNVLAVDDISLMSGYEVRPAVAPEQDIAALIQRLNTLDEVVVAEAIDEDDGRGGRRPARVGRRRAGHQARALAHRPGRRAGRLRHPLRARRGRPRGALPHRRRPERGHAHPAPPRGRRHLAHQDHGRPRHRRAPRAPGRARLAEHRRPRRRRPRRHAAARRRRIGRPARARQGRRRHRPRQARDGRPRARALRQGLLAPARRDPRHRAHRLGQDDDALRRAADAAHAGEEHHHHRGPGRVRALRHQADADQHRRRVCTSPRACAR